MDLLFGSVVCLSVSPECENRSPVARRMSAPGLTSEAQMRYLHQWFGEFSELQREDFLPILAAARGDNPDQLAATLAGLTCEDKPVSLFQCRIKLFNEWFPSWTEEDQDRLIKGVSEIDPEFGEKFQDLIKNGPKLNGAENGTVEENGIGEQNGTGEAHSPIIEEVINESEVCEVEQSVLEIQENALEIPVA